MLTVLGLSCLTLAGCATRDNRAADDSDAVIEWTMLADEFGGGGANWRTIAQARAQRGDTTGAQEAGEHYEALQARLSN